eukprot:3919590-Pyramimonas_sp.AAC.1
MATVWQCNPILSLVSCAHALRCHLLHDSVVTQQTHLPHTAVSLCYNAQGCRCLYHEYDKVTTGYAPARVDGLFADIVVSSPLACRMDRSDGVTNDRVSGSLAGWVDPMARPKAESAVPVPDGSIRRGSRRLSLCCRAAAALCVTGSRPSGRQQLH